MRESVVEDFGESPFSFFQSADCAIYVPLVHSGTERTGEKADGVSSKVTVQPFKRSRHSEK